MKTTNLFAAVALTLAAAAGPALAQEATYEYPQALNSATTRAAVTAELLGLRANGQVLVSEAHVGTETRVTPGLTREAVRAEARAAAKSGLIRALTAEPYASAGDIGSVSPALTMAAK
jgi:hypothetical protein